MIILVINAGSGSLACSLFDTAHDFAAQSLPGRPVEPIWEARIETTRPDHTADGPQLTVRRQGRPPQQRTMASGLSVQDQLGAILPTLWQGDDAMLDDRSGIQIVGHRVVHGGDAFTGATPVDDRVETLIARYAAFAPLHNKSNLAGIRCARSLLPKARHVAVFDTAFHHDLPAAARTYPGPLEWTDQGIRRYGFHGTNFRWATDRAAHLLGRDPADTDLRLIVCHLGGGCSLAAIEGGRSLDTTMGFTPLDGIAMSTRSGSLDPGIVFYLLRRHPDIDALEKQLNKDSGLKGLSGLPGDTRIIHEAAQQGNDRARLAMDVFVHGLRGGIGQMLASLGAMPDAIVFTDAIGEDQPDVRASACKAFAFMGVKIDPEANQRSRVDTDIADAGSAVRVLIVKSREALQIARECLVLSSAA